MKTTLWKPRVLSAFAVIALSILAAPGVEAQCGAAARNGGMSAPAFGSLKNPTALEGFPDRTGSSEARDQESNDSNESILGLWKKLEYSGGVVSDLGFQQFNAGGTELLNDTGPSGGGTNFCMGAWKRVGARTYAAVHPFFVFDASGRAVAIAIERLSFIVAPDGNTFSGTWTQDNYDFRGNVLPGTHSEGQLTGERIAPGLPFPFPFPL
jgi:hypothetical protein